MEITVYASDVRDFGDEVERHLNIEHMYGHNLFDEDDRLDLKDYDYALEPRTYLSIMVDMQEQINELKALVKDNEKILYKLWEKERWHGSMLK